MKIIFVATDGSDTIGLGTYDLPYQTIEKALTVFSSGDQIRLMDGTYTPADAITLNNVEGSIMAEDPLRVTIQPQSVTSSHAVVAIRDSARFFIGGINIQQAASAANNTIGILGERVENFVVLTCNVFDFEVSSSSISTAGIAVSGSGKIEGCNIHDLAAVQESLYGIFTDGKVDVVDCAVYALSGSGDCTVAPMRFGPWNLGSNA